MKKTIVIIDKSTSVNDEEFIKVEYKAIKNMTWSAVYQMYSGKFA
jgi:hypothetical protein